MCSDRKKLVVALAEISYLGQKYLLSRTGASGQVALGEQKGRGGGSGGGGRTLDLLSRAK